MELRGPDDGILEGLDKVLDTVASKGGRDISCRAVIGITK